MTLIKREYDCLKALMLLLVVVALFLGGVLLPWWNKLTFYDSEQARYQGRLDRYTAIVNKKAVLEKRFAEVQKRFSENDLYIRAATTELASAELQRKVKALVDVTDAQLISTQNIGTESMDKSTRISLRVRLNGSVEALASVLYKLEAGKPVVIIDNVSMRSKRISRRMGKRREIVNSVDLSFDMAAYMREQKGAK